MKDALGTVQSVLVLGGGSDLALATCRKWAPRAKTIVLAARKPETLEPAAAQLRATGAGAVEAIAFDATDYPAHDAFVTQAFGRFGDFDVVLLAFGVAAIAAYALGPGLGGYIFTGLSQNGGVNAVNFALVGTIGIVILALVLDLILVGIGRLTIPRGIRA